MKTSSRIKAALGVAAAAFVSVPVATQALTTDIRTNIRTNIRASRMRPIRRRLHPALTTEKTSIRVEPKTDLRTNIRIGGPSALSPKEIYVK